MNSGVQYTDSQNTNADCANAKPHPSWQANAVKVGHSVKDSCCCEDPQAPNASDRWQVGQHVQQGNNQKYWDVFQIISMCSEKRVVQNIKPHLVFLNTNQGWGKHRRPKHLLSQVIFFLLISWQNWYW